MGFEIKDGVLKKYTEEDGFTIVMIPDTVRMICAGAFVKCTFLEKLCIPAQTERIDGGAFVECTNLKEIIVDRENKKYFSHKGVLYRYETFPALGYQLSYCPAGVTRLHISALVTDILVWAFADSIHLEKITVSLLNRNYIMQNGMLCNYAIRRVVRCPVDCKKARLPYEVREIAPFAFAYCKELKEIKLSSNLSIIQGGAFHNCTSLKEIQFPPALLAVGSNAFDGCSGLKEIAFPPGTQNIGKNAFHSCTSLEKITLPGNLAWAGMFLAGCPALKTIVWRNAELRLDKLFPEVFGKKDKRILFDLYVYRLMTFLLNSEKVSNSNPKFIYGVTIELLFANPADNQKEKAFIEAHFMDAVKYLIDENQQEKIKMLMDFMNSHFTRHNIQELIMYANEKEKYEIQVMLMDYKARHFGNESQEEIIRRKFEL